jgi:hypothetical protein
VGKRFYKSVWFSDFFAFGFRSKTQGFRYFGFYYPKYLLKWLIPDPFEIGISSYSKPIC